MVRIKCTLKPLLSRKPFSMLSNRQKRRISHRNLLNKKTNKNLKKSKRLVNARIAEDEKYQNSTMIWLVEKSTPVNRDFNEGSNNTCTNVFLVNDESSISQARSNMNINMTINRTLMLIELLFIIKKYGKILVLISKVFLMMNNVLLIKIISKIEVEDYKNSKIIYIEPL